MSKHEQLLQELQGYARSATGVEALMAQIAHRLHEEIPLRCKGVSLSATLAISRSSPRLHAAKYFGFSEHPALLRASVSPR